MSSNNRTDVTGFQIAAGRALLGLSRATLAEQAGVAPEQLKNIERLAGPISARDFVCDKVRSALESLGVQFIPENDAGAGVRLKFNRQETRQIGRWENEGGLIADDDAP